MLIVNSCLLWSLQVWHTIRCIALHDNWPRRQCQKCCRERVRVGLAPMSGPHLQLSSQPCGEPQWTWCGRVAGFMQPDSISLPGGQPMGQVPWGAAGTSKRAAGSSFDIGYASIDDSNTAPTCITSIVGYTHDIGDVRHTGKVWDFDTVLTQSFNQIIVYFGSLPKVDFNFPDIHFFFFFYNSIKVLYVNFAMIQCFFKKDMHMRRKQ